MNTSEHKYTNQLIHESSPYLLQHAHNPVNWYPWGNEALKKAKDENKPIIVSIGYAACHWCHVMEHESFENEEVANFMNDHFVAIKVDREERPDIDQVYMNAIQLMSGRGGWPLNCIALPDGRPIYGGTYFPKAQWMELLAGVSNFVLRYPEKAEEQANSLVQGIISTETIELKSERSVFSVRDLNHLYDSWKDNFDVVNGGNKGAPKFPMPAVYQFLLFYHYLTGNEGALKAVTTTLNKMANGGIYDQIGSGFSRYSTDDHWKVPHFEKMLYDNAQLVTLYSSAYQLTKNPAYKNIVSETLDFIQRELTSGEGGFYSSLDADSEGVEGKFYAWTKAELSDILGDHAELVIDYFNVSERGNWENFQNILFKTKNDTEIADKYRVSEDKLTAMILEAKKLLLKERANRVRPGLDDKILTSGNALMIKGCVDAYRVFDVKIYLDIALRNAEFINSKLKSPDNRLDRNYKNGKPSINAFLDDYAFTISAFTALYQATFDEKWIMDAYKLTIYTLSHFYNEENGMFYYTSDIDPPLVARKMEISDNVIPSSNSEMAKNLFMLGHYFYNEDYIEKSKRMLRNVKQNALENGIYYANWDSLMTWFAIEPYEVAIVGNDYEVKRKEFDLHYLPNVFWSGGKNEGSLPLLENKLKPGETTIYVCKNKVCQLPVSDVKEALEQMNIPGIG